MKYGSVFSCRMRSTGAGKGGDILHQMETKSRPSHPVHSDHSSLPYDSGASVLGQPHVQVGIECITEGERRAREASGEPATEMDGCGGHTQARLLPRRMVMALPWKSWLFHS